MTQLLNDFLSGSAAWGVLLTLAAFALGTLINKVTGKAIFNPLLLGSIFVIIFLSVCNIPYADYKASAAPVNYLLLPATVALAIPLYEKIDLLKENAAAIIAGISVGTLVSLGSALALALALDLTREQYATLLPKSVTTAISMGLGHHDDDAVALGGCHSGQTDASIAGGRLNDHGTFLQQALFLGIIDHLFGDAILDRTGRIEVFQLGNDVGRQLLLLFNVGQLQQRSMTDQLICGSINLAHCSFLPDTVMGTCALLDDLVPKPLYQHCLWV